MGKHELPSVQKVWLYTGRLFSKLLSVAGGISTIASITLFFFGNRILPDTIPSFFLGIMLFILTLLACSYFVWADQTKLTDKVKSELIDLKATVPVFSIEKTTVTRYTIAPIIQKYKQILERLEPKKVENTVPTASPTNNEVTIPISNKLFNSSLLSATKAAQSAMRSLSQLKLAGTNLSVGGETSRGKFIRIQEHVAQLEKYERELSTTYKLDIVFSSLGQLMI